ncbi:MAG: DUF2259 domain-containing protein [Bauldia sp.]
MRQLLLALLAMVAFALPARAGDYAALSIIGFSADGAYFAFEEYGIQDGSGFPYSAIYIVETATDTWLEGSPYSVRLDSEGALLADARNQALGLAANTLNSLAIFLPGAALVSNPLTEIVPNPHVQDFYTTLFTPLQDTHFRLEVTEQPLAAADCPDFGDTYVGYALTLTDPAGASRDLHRDEQIPGSRNCPIGYGISDVILFDNGRDVPVLMVMLNLWQVGFEGPNRRFLAVAATLPR